MADEALCLEIKDVLVQNFNLAASAIAATDREAASTLPIWRSTDHTYQSLSRIKKHVNVAPQKP